MGWLTRLTCLAVLSSHPRDPPPIQIRYQVPMKAMRAQNFYLDSSIYDKVKTLDNKIKISKIIFEGFFESFECDRLTAHAH